MKIFFRTFVFTKISTLQNTRETNCQKCNTGLDFFRIMCLNISLYFAYRVCFYVSIEWKYIETNPSIILAS